ncbi:MAG TPA: hypothetical protein VFX60_14280, partial [Micromonospora sp.]|nr:hypothetical protein [Micromonospora sp.]
MNREPTELRRFGLPLAWLAHPVTVIAVALLAVNDHLLKAAYPGLLTGKLSDAAGLIAAPPLLALAIIPILPHRPASLLAGAAVLFTGVGFTAVKLSQTAAVAVSAAWSTLVGPSVILADPTDLATLPALALAWWVWTRARQRPVSRPAARRFGTLIVLPAATLAMVATPAPRYPDAVAVTSWRGMIVIGEGDAFHEGRKPIDFQVSHDGQSWRSMTETERTEFGPVAGTLPFNELRDCVPDQPSRCYRAVPGHLRVEETRDGGATWSTSWQVPDDRRGYLARQYSGLGDVDEYLSSRALLVHPVPGGHVVIVANGRDGYALRDTAGRWERIGFGADRSDIGRGPTG